MLEKPKRKLSGSIYLKIFGKFLFSFFWCLFHVNSMLELKIVQNFDVFYKKLWKFKMFWNAHSRNGFRNFNIWPFQGRSLCFVSFSILIIFFIKQWNHQIDTEFRQLPSERRYHPAKIVSFSTWYFPSFNLTFPKMWQRSKVDRRRRGGNPTPIISGTWIQNSVYDWSL